MQTYDFIVTGLENRKCLSCGVSEFTIVDIKCVGIWGIQWKSRNVQISTHTLIIWFYICNIDLKL